MKRLGRAFSVVTGGHTPPGQTKLSEVFAGDAALLPKDSSVQLSQPLASGGTGGPVGRVGDHTRSPSLTIHDETPKPSAKSGKSRVKPTSSAVTKPKRGRKGKQVPVQDPPATLAPPSDTGLSRETSPRSSVGVSLPRPPDSVVIHTTESRDGLISGGSRRSVTPAPTQWVPVP